jgi:U32 family peptidase
MNRPELLAPAGNFICAEAAFNHGADAIYIGVGQLNLRAHSPNFAIEDLPELMNLSRQYKKKVYVALNVMPDQKSISLVSEMLLSIKKNGSPPDAFIISDPGVLVLCKEILPEVELHLSTQTGTFNLLSVEFWKHQGISRVVLPREFSTEQIAEITRSNIMETEIFIHGAMCVSISGRCLLGAYTAGRHPNRGDCPQPCRWKYKIGLINENKDVEQSFDAEESEKGVYLLNSKDLCTIDIIPQIVSTGVHSLKIEGRNKSDYYVASVVRIYRAAIDKYIDDPQKYEVLPEWRSELEALEHRTYTTGFYNGESVLQDVFTSKASVTSRIIGTVKALLPGGLPVIDVNNCFTAGEMLEVIPVVQKKSLFSIEFAKISDLNGNTIDRAPSNRLVVGYSDISLRVGDMLRKKSS